MKETILNTVDDLVSNFLYYDRKHDEDLPTDTIEREIKAGNVTVDEIVERFRAALLKELE